MPACALKKCFGWQVCSYLIHLKHNGVAGHAVQGSQVAEMRAKVKELRETLASRVKASSTSSDSISTNKEISSLITAVAAVQARESMNTMHTQMQTTQQQSMQLDDGTLLSEEEVLELEMLQLENEQLRCDHSFCTLPLAICPHSRCRRWDG